MNRPSSHRAQPVTTFVRHFRTVVYLFTVPLSGRALAVPPVPPINAFSAAVMNDANGTILAAKNLDVPVANPSTTKIMTALLLLEQTGGNLDRIVTVSSNAANAYGSRMNLATGDQISLRDLLYGMLLPSGNDAAVAIAESVGGSEANFVAMMNQRASALGLTNTAYRSPAGYDPTEKPNLCFPPYSSQPNCGHYTSARDLTNLSRVALQQPLLSQAVQTTNWSTATWRNSSGSSKNQNLTNTNLLLSTIPYSGANGVKTGEGPNAGWCIVARATRSNQTLLTVVMDTAPDNETRHNESIQLLDYGFARLLGVQAFANGSFERGESNWTITGNCDIVSGAAASAGTKSVRLNGGQTTPLGTIAQHFATVPGQAYTFTFDYGIASPSRLTEQRLEVTVSGNSVLLSQTVSQSSASAAVQYVRQSFTFVADGPVTTLTFRDLSAVTDSVDSFLDNVQIAPDADAPRVLGVTSNGAAITVSFYGVQGRTYRLERRTDFSSATWQTISGVNDFAANTTGPAQIVDPAGGNDGRAFYRVRLLP